MAQAKKDLQKLFDHKWDHRLDVADHPWPDDLGKIVNIIYAEFGVMMTGTKANVIWRWYSEHLCCATWMQVTDFGVKEAFTGWMAQH